MKIFLLGVISILVLFSGCNILLPSNPEDKFKQEKVPMKDFKLAELQEERKDFPSSPLVQSNDNKIDKTNSNNDKNESSPHEKDDKDEIDNTNNVVETAPKPNVQSCEEISFVSPKVLDLLGCEIIQILAQPERVNSFKLKSKPDPSLPIANRLGIYPIQANGQGQNLEGVNLQKFQELVFSEKSYHFEMVKSCRFRPNIGLHFVKGDKAVEVLLSFSCNLWTFVYGETEKLENFDPIQSQLIFLNSLFSINTEDSST